MFFIKNIRDGRNQNDISKLEEEISRKIKKDIGNLEGVLTGHNCEYVQQSLRQFQRFIYNLLIAGCRFTQVQRGSTQNSLDDLVSLHAREQIDPHLPYTEIGLLQLINISEVQIRSRSESLLYQILHITFGFNTNIFGLIDKLDSSIKTVEQLLLPSSYMIIQMWNSIDTLIHSISKNLTIEEKQALVKLCEDFFRMTQKNAKLKDVDLFLSEQINSGLIADLFEHIEILCNVLEKNRSKMKIFSNDFFSLWHITLKEILRGFIKARKYHIHTILESNDQKTKDFHLIFNEKYSDIKLYDINRLLDQKDLLSRSITNNQQAKYLPKLQKIQILYSFLLGLIDNLENTIMSMSLEPINSIFLKELIDKITKFYTDGYKVLEVPLIKFITDNKEIDRLLNILDETRRLQTTIFHNQAVNSKDCVEKTFNELQLVRRKFQECVRLAKNAYSDWQDAYNNLIERRHEKRRENRSIFRALASSVWSFLTPSSNNKYSIDEQYIDKICVFMTQHQCGTESIFVAAPQQPILKLIELLRKHGKNADDICKQHKITKLKNFIQLQIKCLSPISQITLQFFGKNEYASIQLPLTHDKDNIYNFVIDKKIDKKIDILRIILENNILQEIEWSKILKTSIELSVDERHIGSLSAHHVYFDSLYTIVGNSEMLPNSDERANMVQEIYCLYNAFDKNCHEHNKDREKILKSPVTHYLKEMSPIYDSIINTIDCKSLSLQIPELFTAHKLSELYNQLPTLETLRAAQINIEMKNYTLPFSITPVSVHDINERQDINEQYTYQMAKALDKSNECKERMRLALDSFISSLCDIRVQLFVCYAWTNSTTNDANNESEKIMNMFLEQTEQLYNLSTKDNESCKQIQTWTTSMANYTNSESEKIMENFFQKNAEIYSLLQKTNENINRIHMWEKKIQHARHIYQTKNQTATKWQEIYYFISIPLSVETNVQYAFLHSKSAGDAYIWFHFPDQSSQQTNNIYCEPKLAFVNFGIVLSGIRQRFTQRIILHNQTDKNINIQIEQDGNPSTDIRFEFNMVPDKMIVPMQDVAEINVIFKSPDKFIGQITEMLNLKINDKTMPKAIQLCVHMVKADLEIGSNAMKFDQDNQEYWTIDFGRVPCCYSVPIIKSIELKNLLDCTLNVKAQIQTNQNVYHTKLDIIKDELILDGKTTAALRLKFQPSENNSDEEDFEAIICLAISPSKTTKLLKVKVCIRRPRLSITYQNRPLVESLSSPMILTISDFYIDEHRSIPFQFENIGETDLEFCLISKDLEWKSENKSLKINESTTVTIEIRLPSQTSRTKFIIHIQFINIKYYYTLEIICEAFVPRLNVPAKITKIIEISKEDHLKALCYEENKSLKPIIFEGTFTNRSKAVATLSSCRFISENKQDIKFNLKSNNLKIGPDTRDVKVNFTYQPINLYDLKGHIELQSNCWPQPKMIECSLEIKRPIFQSNPHAMIEWGKIENGRTTRRLLIIKNNGSKVLRLDVDSVKLKPNFIKIASINRPTGSINYPIEINPNAEDPFDINIECESLESTAQIPSPIELAEFNLISLRDPIMSIDGQFKERTIKILLIGHLSDVDRPRQLNEKAFKEWKDLRLIQSSWIRNMTTNKNIFEPYSLFITMVSAAYAANSNQITTLPHNIDDYKSLLNPIHGQSDTQINPLTLDDISNDPSSTIVNLLYKYFRTIVEHQEFFRHSIQFHQSFNNMDVSSAIRLQLYGTINSTLNNDEVYTMQLYVTTILTKYNEIKQDDNLHCQALETIYKCIGKDPLMPDHLKPFIRYLHLVAKPQMTNTNEIESLLTDMIKQSSKVSSASLRDLLTVNSVDIQWTFYFSCIPTKLKEILMTLIDQEGDVYSSLLSCHLAVATSGRYSNMQTILLEALKSPKRLWKDIDQTDKRGLLSAILSNPIELIDLVTTSIENIWNWMTVIKATRYILEYFHCSENFSTVEDVFKCDYYDINNTLLNLHYSEHQISDLKSKISSCKHAGYLNVFIDDFCEILHTMLSLNPNQLYLVKESVKNFSVFYHTIISNTSTVARVLMNAISLASEFHPYSYLWVCLRDKFNDVLINRDANNLTAFIEVMVAIDNKNSSVSKLRSVIHLVNHMCSKKLSEKTFEHAFQLCRMMMTDDKCIELDHKRELIQEIPSTQSVIESLTVMHGIVSDSIELQQLIGAYLHLIKLPTNLITNYQSNDEQAQFDLLEQIVPSWLILNNESSVTNLHCFDVLSSVLTSFYGLLISRGTPFKERLYTLALATALCTLSNCRFAKCVIDDQPQQTKYSSKSLVDCIRQKIPAEIQSVPVTISEVPKDLINNTTMEPANDQQSEQNQFSRQSSHLSNTNSYSSSMLGKMYDIIKNYCNEQHNTNQTLKEVDRPYDIIEQAINNHRNIDQWLTVFTTFNIILRRNLDSNTNTDVIIIQGRKIIERGLLLLLHSLIIKRILEPTFSRAGIQFIIIDMMRLEKCLLSLALENYPCIRQTLHRLQVDVSRIKQIMPSRKFNPLPSRQLQPDQNTQTTTLPTDNNQDKNNKSTDISTTLPDPNKPMSPAEWLNVIKNNSSSELNKIIRAPNSRLRSSDNLISGKTNLGGGGGLTNATSMNSTMLQSGRIAEEMSQELRSSGAGGATTGPPTNDYNSLSTESDKPCAPDIKFKFTEKHLRDYIEHMKKKSKDNIARQMGTTNDDLADRIELGHDTKIDQWTYSKLIDSKAIALMIDTLLEQFRTKWEELLNNRTSQLEVHWCIMIDNSGSMSPRRNIIYESLVILMELLRKMEFKFSVARFGGRTSQKILKDMNQLFTNKDGQFILEAITFDEGTYPATGLKRIANKVFSSSKSESKIHRIVLMVTDGLTDERDSSNFSHTISTYDIKLGIMFIESIDTSANDPLLQALGNLIKSRILPANDKKNLPIKLAELMNDMLEECTDITIFNEVYIKKDIPTFDSQKSVKIASVDEKENLTYQSANRFDYKISQPNRSIPKLDRIEKKQITDYLSSGNTNTNYLMTLTTNLREFYQKFTTDNIRNDEQLWDADERRLTGLIDELTTVLGDVVFPINKFTRRRAALRGSSLYLPGLIKAMTSEWTYKKIFSAKLAGGKRNHASCIVLDVSPSMYGHLGRGLQGTLVALIGAFQKLSLENYGIIVFGSRIRLIKTNEQSWDAACKTILLQQIQFDQDDDTKDAEALELAIDLLTNSGTRGEKKIFIITDGYSNSGIRLPLVQQRAEDANIDVIAMAIGDDRTYLHGGYKRYLRCKTPYGLPKALRALFDNEPSSESIDPPMITKRREDLSDAILNADNEQRQQLFSDLETKKEFKDIIEILESERETALVDSGDPPLHMICDICFCIDCTGSMSQWLDETKNQMKLIIKEIKKQISEKYPSLKLQLRFAIVGFRDIGDAKQFDIQDFTHDENVVTTFLNQLIAYGGDDLPEDVLGALDQCLELKNWSKSNARFIILFTDAPGHGRDLNDEPSDKYPNGTNHTVATICERLLTQDSGIQLMFCCINPTATEKMQKLLEKEYNSKTAQTGREFKTIKLFGDQPIDSRLFHFVFVLDESGSMGGTPQQSLRKSGSMGRTPRQSLGKSGSMSGTPGKLVKAYQSFLDRRRNDQGGNDLFSVVQFDSVGRIIYERKHLADAHRNLNMNGGGTEYLKGLEEAAKVIANDTSTSTVMMIFMSDGGDGGPDPLGDHN